ncbi:MAG: STAS domain-containing protein [Terriglobales bacterium]|jgi:anti-sigma B factor antagonist|nr:STAS domain-containing protein [Terriglobales bacterium]
METAIGVFASRDIAEDSVKELLERGVPESSLVFLTRSESEAKTIGKQLGAFAGGFAGGAAGMTAGVAAATLLLPGIGAVFALGFGAAALLGLAGAGAGASTGAAIAHESKAPQPTPDAKSVEDAAFFREVLKEGRSLVVVRTESQDIALTACAVLDRLALGMQGSAPVKMKTVTRQVGSVVIIDVSGRITLGEGNVMLREIVRDLAAKGTDKIVLNLGEVLYVDSSGVGELVKAHATIRNKGGVLKLTNLNKRVHELLQMTRLSSVFDIEKDEASALKSLGAGASEGVA